MNDTTSSSGIVEGRPHRRRFSWIWLIPLAAAIVVAYLGYASWTSHGPLITVDFDNAEGVAAGQTQVRYKSVPIGVVESIRLTPDFSRVQVAVRMQREVAARLTGNARFWVVRPRLTAGNVSGLETIVSGPYIEFDPGTPGGAAGRAFIGLEEPPAVRTGEPGRVFAVRAQRLGALGPGSTVMLRDMPVGEVLSVDPLTLDGDITLRVFIHAPYDGYVRQGSRFWNTSGISANFGPNGLKVEFESLRAALTGGIAFDTPTELLSDAAAPDGASFPLYESQQAAVSATSAKRLEFLTYLEGSASGLSVGSPVEVRGIRIGSVTSVDLVYDVADDRFVVPVHMEVEPGRIASPGNRPPMDVLTATNQLVARGYRVHLRSGNLLTGQKVLAIDPVADAPPATVRLENGVMVLPALGGDGDIIQAVGEMADKLQHLPLEEIGRNLNMVLVSLNGVVGGPEMRGALIKLSGTLTQVQELVRKADGGLSPLFGRLPEITRNLNQTVEQANAAMGSIERGYGADSAFGRQATRAMQEVSDASKAIGQLADFLERHPEALVRGRGE